MSAPKEIIFLGSKPIGYNCLKFLIGNAGILNLSLKGVLTKNRTEFGGDHDLAALAQQNGIEVFESLDDMPECDFLYSVQYHEILKARHIEKARELAVNLHMAPLPEYRGSNQFSFALIEGKEEFGTTLHRMLPGVDNGPIIFQKRFPIPENCWVGELYDITVDKSLKLFIETLRHVVTGNFREIDQELLVSKYGTSMHYRNEMNQIKVIDLNWDKEKIERHIRATSMPGFEPPYCIMGGKKVYLTDKYQ